ncbi:MAG: hypothetical protein ACI4S2_15420 [Lachnospiraceae bacterium]
MKYNYVIFATVFDWYRYMYKDVIGQKHVAYYKDFGELLTPIERFFYKIHLSKKLNRIVPLPKKHIWYKRALARIHFEDDRPICFIWYSHFFKEIDNGMPEYIKKVMPDAKNVYYYTDQKNITDQGILKLREKMDLIGVFDLTAAEQYKLQFWPNVYPSIGKSENENEYDLCFIGKDKGRQKKLEEIAAECDARGIRTAFYLLNAESEKRCESIHYMDKLIPYEEALDLVKKSNCVLELKMGSFDSCSVRVEEAVLLGKRILTNNSNVNKMPCCRNSAGVVYFDDISKIDWNFVTTDGGIEYNYKGEYSAEHFLENIRSELEKL